MCDLAVVLSVCSAHTQISKWLHSVQWTESFETLTFCRVTITQERVDDLGTTFASDFFFFFKKIICFFAFSSHSIVFESDLSL